MASNISNWARERGAVTEKDRLALQRAKKIERMQEKDGYRWVKINERIRLYVPCDANGKPTREGRRRIAILKESEGIK